ncbi:MAG: GldG family protein, partial [Myxococcales bacterium]|nr:GldG family protein [Myxococcales bacterium]
MTRPFLPILATLLAGCAANLWAMRSDQRFDLTDHGVYSLAPESREIAEAIDQPVSVTFFYDGRSRSMRDARELLESLAAASPRIELRVADPAHQPALAERYGVRFAGTAVFESGGRTVTTHGATETEFVNGLIRATYTGAQRICFTSGHVESDPHSLESHDHAEGESFGHHHHGDHSSGGRPLRIHERHGLGMARQALATLGYEIVAVSLTRGDAPLEHCSLLVVASPQVSFAAREIQHVETFLDGGGAALLLLEPGITTGLELLLARYGISISEEPVRDPAEHYGTDVRSPAVTNYPRHRLTRN